MESPIQLRSQPGIKRDGTKFEGDFHVDGQWVRWQRGLPRKIWGYRSINKYLSEISRGFTAFTQSGLAYCHSGGAGALSRYTIDSSKNTSLITSRTPAGLTSDDNYRWMFDYAYDSSSSENLILAHVAPNGECICNDLGGAIYSGSVTGTSALTAITLPAGANATGGIVALHPYFIYYGTAGIVGWSVAGDPTDLVGSGSGIARPWGQKIIKGLPLRGGSGSSPAGIFWAYDAVLRATFTGGATVFAFDVIATGTSIMSADSVVDYDGVFYWAGVDRFMMFNGVVREVPNDMNANWFFDNLNPDQHSKVFAFKVPRFGEIWWCYPRGDAEECTHAIILNVRENTWYDTALPADMRSAGTYSNAFHSPIIIGATNSGSGYKTWIHEQGLDEIDGQDIQPINSYFETADLSAMIMKGESSALRIGTIEPDFVQVGPMTAQVTGRANARAPEVVGPLKTFQASASQPYEQIVMLKEQRRELRVRFGSNEVGGDYQTGQVLAHIDAGDKTVLG